MTAKVEVKKSPYVTRAGWDALDQELKYLWRVERPMVTQSVSEAAALGDRSENAEYIYGKKRLREIDKRVRYLTKRLEVLKIVEYSPSQEGKVFFGAIVSLENETGEIEIYRIVGSDEFNPKLNWISVDSPVAKALLGKSVGDEVNVMTPSGSIYYFILDINYVKST
ncbi:transcription elongation factor GreB [Thorsellia anophelis]|uniref:transcription elongation factor GreB n=1 Tax=Thorsellia anophelis TaxID=336804 RepID=UPI000B88DDB9|nr:transcription elongation factor GreB [Thorsellia anophelis]